MYMLCDWISKTDHIVTISECYIIATLKYYPDTVTIYTVATYRWPAGLLLQMAFGDPIKS